MTNEQINKAIAEVCGWKHIAFNRGWVETGDGETQCVVPDYCNDLNAMHEAERTSTIFKSWRATKTWMENLCICSDLGRLPESAPDWAFVLQATPRQRAKAFLKTLGKWEDAK